MLLGADTAEKVLDPEFNKSAFWIAPRSISPTDEDTMAAGDRCRAIRDSWKDQFEFKQEAVDGNVLLRRNGRHGFLAGTATNLNKIARASRFKEVRAEILIVQPGYLSLGEPQSKVPC
jgi:hypothetical protein